jgi:peptide/nickel transport system permease protein
MVETLSEDYIVTARAKGVKERTVVLKHALRNASLPIITSVALAFGFMLSGAIITETVFSWPGLGGTTWDSIQRYDYPILHVIFFVIALCVIIANFVADLLYGIADPRIKYG